jgi:probable HAF family extracellular repeat protein
MRNKWAFLAAVVLIIQGSVALGEVRYTLTNIGTLPGGSYDPTTGYNNSNLGLGATGINDLGQVVGTGVTSSGLEHAFLWNSGGGIRDLGTLPGGKGSGAGGINNAGQIVGYSYPVQPYVNQHAFLWTTQGGMQDLNGSGGSINAMAAYAINESGQITGHGQPNEGAHAFLWTVAGGVQDLGTLPGYSYANDINEAGVVAGYSGPEHAVIWNAGGQIQDLGTLGGTYSYGLRINNGGEVVGTTGNTHNIKGTDHAFLYTPGLGMRDLGTLGGAYSEAHGINDNEVVTGYSATGSGSEHAFIWTASNGMQDLNDLVQTNSGWVLEDAVAVNSLGQIIGNGTGPDGLKGVFLLNPVPEPAMLSLLAAGGLAMLRRRQT